MSTVHFVPQYSTEIGVGGFFREKHGNDANEPLSVKLFYYDLTVMLIPPASLPPLCPAAVRTSCHCGTGRADVGGGSSTDLKKINKKGKPTTTARWRKDLI